MGCHGLQSRGVASARVTVLSMVHDRLRFRLSSDCLAGFVTVAEGPRLQSSDFDEALLQANIRFGIDAQVRERLVQLLARPSGSQPEIQIASGVAPQPGSDAVIELKFAAGIQPGSVRHDGTVDYHERGLLKPVHHGDVLAVVHGPTLGQEGRRVDGEPVAAPAGKDLGLQLGSGVERDQRNGIRACRDGVVVYVDGRSLDVVDHHIHQGQVDLHSGNLSMSGSLTIRGDVLHPFSATASGDVALLGSVDAGTVRAGGCLEVHGSVRGSEDSSVAAEGNVSLTRAESAHITSGGLLRLQEAVNCTLQAVTVQVDRRIRGGATIAEQQIVAKEAGASAGVSTRLVVGEPLSTSLDHVRKAIVALKAERMSMRVLNHFNERKKGGKIGRIKAEIESREVLQLSGRARRRQRLLRDAVVRIECLHPGVSIQMGQAHLEIDHELRQHQFRYDEASDTILVEKLD